MTQQYPEIPLSPLRLESIAADFAKGAHRWHSLVRHHPEQRFFQRLHRADDYEVWVLGWDLAQGIELHDHGGSSGAVCLVEGQLVETYTDTWTRRPIRRRMLGPGDPISFHAEHVHDLVNPGPALATSVHVYAPVLETMTYYDDRPGAFLAPLRTELAEERHLAVA